MGAAASTEQFIVGAGGPFGTSVEVAPAKGESGAVRRQLKYKDKLLVTGNDDVHTLYDGWQ